MTRNELLLEILVAQLSQVPTEQMIANFIDDLKSKTKFPEKPREGQMHSMDDTRHTFVFAEGKWNYVMIQ